MTHCYNHIIESTKVVHQLIGGSSDRAFQLNERQCQILAKELEKTTSFLEKRSAIWSKFGEGLGSISLQHLCSSIKRAEVLVKKCCCKDLESWLVSAMMLVEIQEEFMVIILDIHLWRLLLDFAITCGKGLSFKKKAEEMKIIDEEYHQLFKDLQRESHALWQAAIEDKKTIILRVIGIANHRGSTSGLDYLRAIYLHSWLTGSAHSRDMELTNYEFVKVLGKGASGTVLKVKWLGVECALKTLGGQDEKEATTLKGLYHPNIIRLFHHWEDHRENPQSHLMMELMPQDLGSYMEDLLKSMGKDSMPFSLHVAIDIMYQIAQAMRYMHDKHLTHRDLKPANILVKKRPQVSLTCIDDVGYLDVKLADFGLVKPYTNTSTFQAHSRNKGTGMYRVPEVFGKDMSQKRHYLPMADVWSFGITCAEILSGRQAYAEYLDDYGLAIQTMIREEGLRPTLPKHCPPYLAFCIKSCWEPLPFRRPTFANLCKLLRHAKLLSLGVMKLDDSKFLFAYTTRSDQVQSLNSSSWKSKARVSTFFQSSLRLIGIRPRRAPSAAEASTMHEVRLVPAPLNTEDSPELHEDIGGGLATPGSLGDGERHSSAILPAAEIVHEELVVSTPIVTEESPPRMANEDVAGSVAALGSPSQRVKSLPDLQEPAELTQASLDNAIPPPGASDSIQPAVTLRLVHSPGLMSATKSDGGKFARDCEVEDEVAVSPSGNPPPWNLAEICDIKEVKEEAVTSSGNRLKEHSHSRQKNKGLDALLFLGCVEGKSIEPELPNFREAASASINLPNPSPPADLKFLGDGSPRYSARNDSRSSICSNDSREADGYQSRDPPPGSHQDDDMGLPPFDFLVAVREVRSAVRRFALLLGTDMQKHPVKLEYFEQTLREVSADVDYEDRRLFITEGFICKRLFDGFDAPDGYFGVEYLENDQITKLLSFGDFSTFKDKVSTISRLLDSDSPDASFLGRFCFKKFKSIISDLASNQPLPIYQEEWDAIITERHPRTKFYQSFLKAAVSVWLLHRLKETSEEKVEMLFYEKGAKFQYQTMVSVVQNSRQRRRDKESGVELDFSVFPGFQLSRSVVRCEVYPRNRSSLGSSPPREELAARWALGGAKRDSSAYIDLHRLIEVGSWEDH